MKSIKTTTTTTTTKQQQQQQNNNTIENVFQSKISSQVE